MKSFISAILITISTFTFSQDTLKIDPPFLTTKPIGRELYKLSKEVIYFNKDHMKIEKCYYLNGNRKCFYSNEYQILNDTLTINKNESWTLKTISNNKFKVKKIGLNHFEVGHSTSLIPFNKVDIFHGLSLTKDTLWHENFINNNSKEFHLHNSENLNKIYSINKVDSIPRLKENQKLPNITLEYADLRPNGRFIKFDSLEVNFTVTKKGKITNISVFRPIYEEYLKEISIKLNSLIVIPASKKGKYVNCFYTVYAFRQFD
jgi:hypothetical protein|tara:strand:+ start:54 stop:836 length:783 start_codon:yes stop_codon:yes gene_type:complete